MILPPWLTDPPALGSLLRIIVINIVLSGDNAVVVALACRAIPAAQKKRAMFLGTSGAIVLMVVFTVFAAFVLSLPYFKLLGGLALFWIAIKMLFPGNDGKCAVEDKAGMLSAIRTIVVADVIMSLDNVIGVAAAADGRVDLIVVGLVISIPFIIYGSNLIIKLLGHFPALVTFGAALIGFIAGETGIAERTVAAWIGRSMPVLRTLVPLMTAASVVLVGKIFAAKPRLGAEKGR